MTCSNYKFTIEIYWYKMEEHKIGGYRIKQLKKILIKLKIEKNVHAKNELNRSP